MFAALVLVVSFTTSAPAQEADVDGTWYRNPDMSDDPEAKVREAVQGLLEKMGKGRGRQIALAESPQLPGQIARAVDMFLQYADELYVELDSKELVVDDGSGRLRIYYLDGKKHERQLPNGVKLETKSSRSGSRIYIEQKANKTKVFETYLFSSAGDRLELTIRLEDKQLKGPLTLKSVYEREY